MESEERVAWVPVKVEYFNRFIIYELEFVWKMEKSGT